MQPGTRTLRFSLLVAVVLLGAGSHAEGAGDRHRALQHFRAAQQYMRAENWDKAELEFSRAIAQDPLLAAAHYGRGQALMAVRRYRDAIRAYVACREAFLKTVEAWRDGRRATERQRDAARGLERALGFDDGSGPQAASDARWQLEPLLERLQREAPDRDGIVVPAPLSLALGSAYFRTGDLGMAEQEYRAAIDANPAFGAAHNNLAVVCLMMGHLADAEEEVKLALRHGFAVPPGLQEDIREAINRTR